jgi:hypothetical protein
LAYTTLHHLGSTEACYQLQDTIILFHAHLQVRLSLNTSLSLHQIVPSFLLH